MRGLFIITFVLSLVIFLVGSHLTKAADLELKYLPPCLASDDCQSVSGISIAEYIKRLYQFGVGIAGILAVGMIAAGAVYRIINAGNSSKQQEGTEMIKSAIWGVVLLLGSYLILRTVNPRLVELKEPELEEIQYKELERFSTEAPDEMPLPPHSTDQTVIDFCKQVAPGNTDCLRGDCHIFTGTRIGCEGYVPLGSSFPMKSGQCKWTGQTIGESYCVLRQQTYGALNVMNTKIPNLYQITEAYPPRGVHGPNGGHYNGCSIDIKVKVPRGRTECDVVQEVMTAARESGFTPNNETNCPGGRASERSTGPHIHLRAPNCP